MGRHISEADWKHLRRLEPLALDRFCRRVLSEIARLAEGGEAGADERYRAVYGLIEGRDGELSSAFDALRRSTAFVQLARIRALGLLTDAEFDGFGAETRAVVEVFLEMWGD